MDIYKNIPILTFVFLVLVPFSLLTYFHVKSYFYTESIITNPIHPVAILTIKDTTSHGSAVHVGNGYFITVSHNIIPNRHILLGIPGDNENTFDATVLWVDADYDIAYLFVPELSHIGQYSINCERLSVGEEVAMHGHPINLNSITIWGRVAGQEIELDTGMTSRNRLTVIPVDSQIVPGMSGGSVVNERGELVGINVGYQVMQTYTFTPIPTGIGYIIPSTIICKLMSV